MLAKKKEKDVIDRMLDQIDFHGMTAEELAMTMPVTIPVTAGTVIQQKLL